jgi:hypothetical protein
VLYSTHRSSRRLRHSRRHAHRSAKLQPPHLQVESVDAHIKVRVPHRRQRERPQPALPDQQISAVNVRVAIEVRRERRHRPHIEAVDAEPQPARVRAGPQHLVRAAGRGNRAVQVVHAASQLKRAPVLERERPRVPGAKLRNDDAVDVHRRLKHELHALRDSRAAVEQLRRVSGRRRIEPEPRWRRRKAADYSRMGQLHGNAACAGGSRVPRQPAKIDKHGPRRLGPDERKPRREEK